MLVVVPAVGIGSARFGMTPAEVRRVLGPEQIPWPEWMEGVATDLIYASARLEFSTSDGSEPMPDSRLESIIVFPRSEVAFAGRRFGDWTRGTFLAELRKLELAFTTDRDDLVLLGTYCGEIYFDPDGTFRSADFWDPSWKDLRQ
jgi:hypothetical protein